MATATGIPAQSPTSREDNDIHGRVETEPLLGRPGDATQTDDGPFLKNSILGTAPLAQFGVILLVAFIWASVFNNPFILFSWHPLAQSLAILTLVQSTLLLQPTHTPSQKAMGQRVHASLNLVAFVLLFAGFTVIEYNKVKNHGAHFHSVHGYMGVIVSMILLVQYFVGFTMWATPALYGGVSNAKSIWKYHRMSGYFTMILLLATVCSATRTEYNGNVLKIKLWATLLLSALILAGTMPRIHMYKFGAKRPGLPVSN